MCVVRPSRGCKMVMNQFLSSDHVCFACENESTVINVVELVEKVEGWASIFRGVAEAE